MPPHRVLLAPVDDNEDCLKSLDWALQEVYREGDVVYLLHIVIKRAFGSGLFPSSYTDSPKFSEDKLQLDHAKSWIEDRFVPVLVERGGVHLQAQFEVMVEKHTSVNALGEIICEKAEQLGAALVILPAISKGSGATYFESNIAQHVVANCQAAVLAWRSS